MFKKVLFNLHWLVGITVGIALAIMGITGAIMSFEGEILSVLNGRPSHVSVTGPALNANEIIATVRAANPGKTVAALNIANDPEQAVKVEFARAGARPRPGEDDGSRYFNQYTGQMIPGTLERGKAFMAWVEHLHRRLTPWRSETAGAVRGGAPPGAPRPQAAAQQMGQAAPMAGPSAPTRQRDLGEQATSYAVLFLMIMALSGLYLRWPRRKAAEWRSWLKINFKLRGYAFSYNFHAVVGTVVFLGYLMSAHSGLMMSEIHWYGNAVRALAGVTEERGAAGRGPAANTFANNASYQLDMLWNVFKREVPEFHTATLQLARSTADELQISYLLNKAVTSEGGRNTNTLVLDANTGAVKRHELFGDKPVLQRVVTRNFDLHSGGYFGTLGRLFIMCTSLMMPVLLVTGWMQYLARRKQKKQRATALKAATATS